MKGIYDGELEFTITREVLNYDVLTDTLLRHKSNVTRNKKNGYAAYDQTKRLIGIVFMSDDKRTVRYGNAELLFFKQYEEEFGTWRIIKQSGKYLPFENLESLLQTRQAYSCRTDARMR